MIATSKNTKSPFSLLIDSELLSSSILEQDLIWPRVESLLDYFEIDPLNTKPLLSHTFTDVNWTTDTLYNEIFYDIGKDCDSKPDFKTKYVTTFDEDLTPLEVEDSGIKYGVIKLGDYPVCLIIYFSVKELIAWVKLNTNQ